MAPVLRFTVPWAALCSDNRKFLSGRFILTNEYRASKQALADYSAKAARKHKWKQATCALALRVTVCEPDRRKRDLNWSKNLKDGITLGEAVWWDDCQVRDEHWQFADSIDDERLALADSTRLQGGGALVEVWALGDVPVTPKRRRKRAVPIAPDPAND
jgi:hypothetical protein